ncbi:MAG: phosphate/phosphite/phosphonate ABC transporter substrate-binding protein, partial [Deltaproteobacteria bacterium]
QQYPVVDLEKGGSRIERKEPVTLPLRVVVAAMVSPVAAHEHYSKMVERIGELAGRAVEFRLGETYRAVNADLLEGKVDFAFLCTGGYLALKKLSPSIKPLCVPRINGSLTYRSYVIVRAKSGANDISDLRGKRFAFTDPLSQTGCIWPRYLVARLGTPAEEFFSSITYTSSHDRSIRAVSLGVVDGAAVDSLVFDEMASKNPKLADSVRIISRSPEFGMPPVVASPAVPESLRSRLQAVMLGLHEDEKASEYMKQIGIERFEIPPDGLYESAEKVFGQASLSP